MQVILYPIDNSTAIMTPTGKLDTMATAIKDVPSGVPFIIVDSSELPDAPQEAWVVDFSTPDGVGGGE